MANAALTTPAPPPAPPGQAPAIDVRDLQDELVAARDWLRCHKAELTGPVGAAVLAQLMGQSIKNGDIVLPHLVAAAGRATVLRSDRELEREAAGEGKLPVAVSTLSTSAASEGLARRPAAPRHSRPSSQLRPTGRALPRPVGTVTRPHLHAHQHVAGAAGASSGREGMRWVVPAPAAPTTGSSVTIAIPLDVIPAVTLAQAPPGLITKHNAGHLGMTGARVLRIIRAMGADARFAPAVIRHGKSFRAAPPEAILEYLRTAPAAAAKEDEDLDLELMRHVGYELATRTSARPTPPRRP